MFGRVDIDGLIWSSMILEVRLPVSLKVETTKPK